MKVKILVSVNANIGGRTWRLNEGDVIDINKADAEHLRRAGYAKGYRAAVKIAKQPQGKPTTRKNVKGK